MQILVQKDGQQLGPYTPDQVNEYLAQGSLQATDPAWHDGLADWCPLNQIAGVVDASSSAPPAFDPETFNPSSAPPPAKVQSSVLSATPDAPPVIASDSSCPQCQAPTKPEMLFCRTCGHELQGDRQVKSVPHSGSPAEDDPVKQNFPQKKVLLVCGGALSLICITALLYWIFVGFGINPVGTYEGKLAVDPSDTPTDCIYTLHDNGTSEFWIDGEKIGGKWELQGEEVHLTMVYDGDEMTIIFQLYENRLEMIAAQMGTVRRNLGDESEGMRGRVFVKTEGNKSPASIASKPQDEAEPDPEVGSPPSESDLRVFKQLETVAEQINSTLPQDVDGIQFFKVKPELPRKIHYYYKVPVAQHFSYNNPEHGSRLRNTYKTSSKLAPFRRDNVTMVWHYLDEGGNEFKCFRLGRMIRSD